MEDKLSTMDKIIGSKSQFAIGINIMKYEPWIWGNSCLWINNTQIGDYTDENILGPFMRSLMRLAMKFDKLWLEELDGLICNQMFEQINPFFNNPDEFFDLPVEKQNDYIKYDIFLFEFGENFDDWIINPVIKNGNCKFIWLHDPSRGKERIDIKSKVNCFDVPLEKIQEAYKEFVQLIPDQYWPKMLEKL